MTPKGRNRLSPSSLNNFYYYFIFWSKGLSSKFQFKIEFWPPGLGKVYKDIVDNCPPFRPILSSSNTPNYKLAKFFIPILKPLISDEYKVKYSFVFAEVIVEQDSEFFMGSLDVDSLFTNIPLEETIDICTNALFINTEKEGLSKIEFKELLSRATKESYFIFQLERKKQNRMSFLDVHVICEDKTFTTSVYRKPTFSGVYTHFDSFLPSNYTFGTVYTIAYWCEFALVGLNYTMN